MDEILELAKPVELEIPASDISELKKLREISDRELSAVGEHTLLTSVVMKSHKLTMGESYSKIPITVGSQQIERYVNCTDETIAQMTVLGKIGTNGIARFNGSHASTLVPSESDGFWHLEGHVSYDLRHSKKADPHISPEKIEATNIAIEKLKDYQNVYVYQDAEDGIWKTAGFDGDKIRANSPLKKPELGTSRLHDSFILLDNQQAFKVLTALDILESLKRSRLNSKQDMLYTIAKSALIHLIPKLR